MKIIQSYLIINLVLLVGYTVFCKIITWDDPQGLGYVIMMLLFVGGQTFINVIGSIVHFAKGNSEAREKGKTLLLCAGVTLVIGFSACIGGGSLSLK